MAKIEAYWDCSYCGSKAIRGRERVCPACGKTRASEAKFYMLDREPVADESAVEAGPDWFCPYCDSYNPHSANFCKNCGHPREAEDKDYFTVRQAEDRRQQQKAAEIERASRQESAPAQTGRKRASKGRFVVLAVIAVLLIAGIVGLLPHSSTVTVLEKSWQRSVDIEEYRLTEASGWTLPGDAVELLGTSREIHHYDQVFDHYETVTETRSEEVFDGYDTYTTYNDLGNGYFEEEEHQVPRYRTEYYTVEHEEPVYIPVPVYETMYRYTIWQWVFAGTETTSGTNDDPYWPQISVSDTLREAGRSEQYSVVCANKKGAQSAYACDPELWFSLKTGGSYKIQTQSGRIIGLK